MHVHADTIEAMREAATPAAPQPRLMRWAKVGAVLSTAVTLNTCHDDGLAVTHYCPTTGEPIYGPRPSAAFPSHGQGESGWLKYLPLEEPIDDLFLYGCPSCGMM